VRTDHLLLENALAQTLPARHLTDDDRGYRAALVRRFDERGEAVSIGTGRMADEIERLRGKT